MAKWLKDYLNFGSRRDGPQLPRPDYTESAILRAYRAQKDLDFEDPYQSAEKPQNGGCRGTVKVVSPKHRLIKVDSQEFSRSKIPLSPVTIHQEPVLPSAPAAVGDSDTVYSDPFDARPVPRLRADWEPNPSPHLSLGLSPITSPTLVAFSPNPILGLSLRPGDSSSYMEPFEAQRVITELQQGPERGRPGVGSGRVGIGDQLYDDPYDERTRHRHREAPPQQGREFLRDEPREVRESRLPQDDERPAEEYDQPWEWKKDNISKALAVKFEGAEWEKSLGQSDQAKLPRTSPTAPGGAANLRRPGDTPPVLGERVDPCLPLERQVWYHGAVSRAEAETLLMLCKESSYLVRKSQTCPKDYSLSLRSCQGFMHMKFTRSSESRYVLGENSPPFSSVPEVIHYYTMHKLPIRGAEHLSLLYPVIVQTL
ncbi:SH2 domain-containing adapter protein F-like isoform X2 [Oncorhynchus keta]|uniref:SH2 domain-containing adapter protein F-like isoform X2 n=1 Tax=Oncorhynchus keta TaxID=8018 RepID=UPI0015FC7034|nr:SH2 domain-containing adapter protein F-like isoform X2 [Oncorhynchus keta]